MIRLKLALLLILSVVVGSKLAAEWLYLDYPWAYSQDGWKFVLPTTDGIWFQTTTTGQWNYFGSTLENYAPDSLNGFSITLIESSGITSFAFMESETSGFYSNTLGGNLTFNYLYERISPTAGRFTGVDETLDVDTLIFTFTQASSGTFAGTSVYDGEIFTWHGTFTVVPPK